MQTWLAVINNIHHQFLYGPGEDEKHEEHIPCQIYPMEFQKSPSIFIVMV